MVNIILLAAILNLGLGIIVFVRSKTVLQRNFALLVFVIAAWVFINYSYFKIPRYPFINLSYTLGSFVIAGLFFWIAQLVHYKFPKWLNYLVVFLAIGLSVGTLVPNFMIGSIMKIDIITYQVNTGPFFPIYSVIALIILVTAVIMLIRGFLHSQGLERLRMTYVALGFVIPITIVCIVDFILPFFNILWLAGLDSPLSFIFAGFIAFAITRYRFLDISIIIRKGAIQLVTFAILFALYAYVLIAFQRTGANILSLDNKFGLLIVVIVIAITIEPLRKLIYKLIDSLFESKERAQKEALQRLQVISRSNIHFQDLVQNALQELDGIFGASSQFALCNRQTLDFINVTDNTSVLPLQDPIGQIILEGKVIIADELPFRIEAGEKQLQVVYDWCAKNSCLAIIPLGIGRNNVGVIMLHSTGKKSVITQEKVEFLREFASQSYLAFAGALAYKQAVERIKI